MTEAKKPYFIRVGNLVRSKMRGLAGKIVAVDDAAATATVLDQDATAHGAIPWRDLAPCEDAPPPSAIHRPEILPPIDWFEASQIAAERVANDPAHARTFNGAMVARLGATVAYQAGVLAAVRAHTADPAAIRAQIDRVLPARRRMKGDES